MLRTFIVSTFLFCGVGDIFGQESGHEDILLTDSTWKKEIFVFPLSFAKEIDYQGIEDARFPAGWAQKDSSTFWSYVFAWEINLYSGLNVSDLENDIKLYYDGLMRIDHTAVQFRKNEASENSYGFKGKVQTIDAFFTKEPIVFNIIVEGFYCEITKKSIILFMISPQEFEHVVWAKLKEATIRTGICDYD